MTWHDGPECPWCQHHVGDGDHSLCIYPEAPEIDLTDRCCGHCGDPLAGGDHSECVQDEDDALPWNHPMTGAHESCLENGMPIPEDMADFAPPCPDPESWQAAHRTCDTLGRPAPGCPAPAACPTRQ